MATLSVAAFTPASPTAATLFNGTLVASTPVTITPGFKTIVAISLAGATDAVAAAGIHIRFGSALKAPTAAATDFFIPPATVAYFDLGSEFDRFSIISAGTPSYFVYVMSVR